MAYKTSSNCSHASSKLSTSQNVAIVIRFSYKGRSTAVHMYVNCMWNSELQYLFTSCRRVDFYHRASVMAIAVICVCSSITYTVSLFYCFGVSAGDALLARENNGSSAPISLSIPYRFYGTYESTLYVSQLLYRLHFTGMYTHRLES